jgi:alkylated DNA repair dioxygenase AlkB
MTATLDIDGVISAQISRQDVAALRKAYLDQGEFVVLENLLPREIMDRWDEALEALKPRIHRNYIPGHKKGGSVGYDTANELAPAITTVYHSKPLLVFLRRIAAAEMNECPDTDQHRCALYAYTEAGDHIGWHYDTSYYRDRRWTVLVGFQDNSSSRLVCRLHTRNKNRAVSNLELQLAPGALMLFNGDCVYHAVTPIEANEYRYMVSMQYVTNREMNPFMRFVSNMKDSIAYFGLREVFFGGKRKSNANRP